MRAIEQDHNYLPSHLMHVYDREKATLLATLYAAGCRDITRQFLTEWFGPLYAAPPIRGIEGFIMASKNSSSTPPVWSWVWKPPAPIAPSESSLLWIGLTWRGNTAEFFLAGRELLQWRARKDRANASFTTLGPLHPVEPNMPADWLMLYNESSRPPAAQTYPIRTLRPPRPGQWARLQTAKHKNQRKTYRNICVTNNRTLPLRSCNKKTHFQTESPC